MATRFEIVLHGEDPVSLRAAGEEALDEIDRLEAQLSFYRPSSEVARINARAARESVRVEPGLFTLLQRAAALTQETKGAFDITIAPLMRCWGFIGGSGRLASAEEIENARACTGMHLVQLDERRRTVRFAQEGVMIDLGAIGKGCALDVAADRLREAGVSSALLHGGTSTIVAVGNPPELNAWRVAVVHPHDQPGEASPPLAVVEIRDESLSVSAVWGKSFSESDQRYGHVLDPRSGVPVQTAALAAVVLPSATDSDALSTALLTLGSLGLDLLAQARPAIRSLIVDEENGALCFHSRGIEPLTNPPPA